MISERVLPQHLTRLPPCKPLRDTYYYTVYRSFGGPQRPFTGLQIIETVQKLGLMYINLFSSHHPPLFTKLTKFCMHRQACLPSTPRYPSDDYQPLTHITHQLARGGGYTSYRSYAHLNDCTTTYGMLSRPAHHALYARATSDRPFCASTPVANRSAVLPSSDILVEVPISRVRIVHLYIKTVQIQLV